MSFLSTLFAHHTADVSAQLRDFIRGKGEGSLVLFGAGYQGGLTLLELKALGLDPYVRCFVDNQAAKWGTEVHGKAVHPPSLLETLPPDTRILVTVGHYAPILAQLEGLGFRSEARIIDASALLNGHYERERLLEAAPRLELLADSLGDDRSLEVLERVLTHRLTGDSRPLEGICEHLQYFPPDLLRLGEDEVFLDGGAYDGDTVLSFLQVSGGRFEAIHAFEPDRRNFERLTEQYVSHPLRERLHFYNQALYSHRTQLRFDEGPAMSSRIDSQGGCLVEATSVDETLEGRRATFIKYDLEGAEKEAIPGARRTIETWRPKLAISVYHKADDLWVLPEMIRALTPGYRYYLRHYSYLTTETVLYAIPDEAPRP